MFHSRDVCYLLGISKSTLLRYMKEERKLEPTRDIMDWTNSRQFGLDDIHRVYEFMLQTGKAVRFDRKALDRRVAVYGISIAVVKPRRWDELMENISPIIEKNPDLRDVVELYKRSGLLR